MTLDDMKLRMPQARIGEILLAEKTITQGQLNVALEIQKEEAKNGTARPLGDILVQDLNACTQDDVEHALLMQGKLRNGGFDLTEAANADCDDIRELSYAIARKR